MVASHGLSPVGATASAKRRDRARDPDYRAEAQRIAQFEAIARLIIKYRAERGWSQQELARRVGTSHSAISRIESGQHATSVQTLQRIGEALGMRFVMGFETGPADHPTRELIATQNSCPGEQGVRASRI